GHIGLRWWARSVRSWIEGEISHWSTRMERCRVQPHTRISQGAMGLEGLVLTERTHMPGTALCRCRHACRSASGCRRREVRGRLRQIAEWSLNGAVKKWKQG